jgi:hypothetical protein
LLVIPAKAGILFLLVMLFDSRKISKKLDYKLRPQFAVQAIRYANVRFGFLPSQSRLRGNDDENFPRT